MLVKVIRIPERFRYSSIASRSLTLITAGRSCIDDTSYMVYTSVERTASIPSAPVLDKEPFLMSRRRLTAISLYTGIGGLDFGFEAAGFDTVAGVELDPAACRMARLNRPSWGVLEGDIHNISSEAILKRAGLGPGEADEYSPAAPPVSRSRSHRTGCRATLCA